MAIKASLIFNNSGKPRLMQWYQQQMDVRTQQDTMKEIFRLVSTRCVLVQSSPHSLACASYLLTRRRLTDQSHPSRWGVDDDGVPTATSDLQIQTEEAVFSLLAEVQDPASTAKLRLSREAHVRFLRAALTRLGSNYVSLDASRPWILYWTLHALDLLDYSPSESERSRSVARCVVFFIQQPFRDSRASSAVNVLDRCQDRHRGGFGGGPGQFGHLATTYAAVHALAVIGTKEAFDCIQREKLYAWLLRLKQPDGSFVMHEGGEVDIRGSYCAASVCSLLGLLNPTLTNNMGRFIASCQTYEGGMGALPGVEAHGGYTFCGLAALEILQETTLVNVDALIVRLFFFLMMMTVILLKHATFPMQEWSVSRQMEWMGGLFPLLGAILARNSPNVTQISEDLDLKWLLNKGENFVLNGVVAECLTDALQEYILVCCQAPKGGLRDKPGKHPDLYHSCYCLSGLSIVQHDYMWNKQTADFLANDFLIGRSVGDPKNTLPTTHPVHNIRMEYVHQMKAYFASQ
ncbi:hypothetical protein HDU82_007429 [Entophlyctis luteolus]|nr:hypothetical protein HDU82_007429 [Entophlyctis luteolus]